MRPARVLPFALCLLTAPLHAQSEAALKERFEGRPVILKLAMPGTEDGVDVYPGTDRPLDYPRYASRLKNFGTAIRSGQSALVTKIKVKSNLIEVQLDGGGYGTMGDETSSTVNVSSAPKTKREQNLEGVLRRETDPAKKRAIKEELDELRKDREREDSRNRATVVASSSPLTSQAAATPAPAPTSRLPRKGMLLEEADAVLGTPKSTSQRAEGKLKVVTRTYAMHGGRVTAEFVEGVLIRYAVRSD
jgi:hypothetical protein